MRPTRYHPCALLRGTVPLALAAIGCGPRCDRLWYADRDGDGFGDRTEMVTACERPEGYVADATDCDDRSASVHPGAVELCNGVDDDCDGVIDGDAQIWYRDLDGDGIGDSERSVQACAAPDGYVATPGDCDDTDPTVYPGATVELCDGKDQDCDGIIDEGAAGTVLYFPDEDFDGWGDTSRGRVYCQPPAGWITRGGDCNDDNPEQNPDMPEICNGYDDDCNGLTDDWDPGVEGQMVLWRDADGDGFGDADASPIASCFQVAGWVTDASDCDDSRADVYPGATEVCGGGDEDCNGLVDDADPGLDLSTAIEGWSDGDGDGYGAPGTSALACVFGAGVVGNDDDCDDTDPLVGPDWWMYDGDGDGGGAGTPVAGQGCAPPAAGMVNVLAPLDCDDTDPTIRAGLPDPCGDGVDQDCSGFDPVCGTPIDAILPLDQLGRGWVTGSVATDGYSVVAVGPDLDGDGFGDAILGAGSGTNTDVLVLSGPGPDVSGPWAPRARVASLAPTFGAALVVVPDPTGVGLADLLVGAPGSSAGGHAYLLSAPGFDASMIVVGYTGSALGAALADAGDVTGSGASEVVIGAPGNDAVYLLSVSPGVVAPSASLLELAGGSGDLGAAVATGSDLDGDGVIDLVAGAPTEAYGGPDAGVVYVVSAAETGIHAPLGLAHAVFWGPSGGRLGAALAAGEDFDGDGRPDLLVAAPQDGSDAGAAYVITGSGVALADDAAALVVRGTAAGMSLGAGLALADLDGDGVGDVVLGAPGSDFGGADSGAVFVFYGPASGALDTDDADGMLFGAPGSRTGPSVAVGPIDADPTPELWIAQPGLPGGGAWLVPGP